MRTSRAITITAALMAAATLALAGGGVKETFDKTYPLDAKGVVAVDNVNGDIAVSGWDRPEVSVVATKIGYENSSTLQQGYAFSQLQIGLIGVPKDFVAGVGATIVVPIQVKLPSTDGLRSLQFRAEITPTDASVPPILDQFRQLNIDPGSDFIKIAIPSAASLLISSWTAAFVPTSMPRVGSSKIKMSAER